MQRMSSKEIIADKYFVRCEKVVSGRRRGWWEYFNDEEEEVRGVEVVRSV